VHIPPRPVLYSTALYVLYCTVLYCTVLNLGTGEHTHLSTGATLPPSLYAATLASPRVTTAPDPLLSFLTEAQSSPTKGRSSRVPLGGKEGRGGDVHA